MNVKLLIIHRSESNILNKLNYLRELIRIDSDKINADLLNYIQTRVNKLFTKKNYSLKLKQDIQIALSEKVKKTFLWVSLILKDISETKIIFKIRTKLQLLSSSLDKVYSRILNNIQKKNVKNTRFILQWMIIARQSLTINELAITRALNSEE